MYQDDSVVISEIVNALKNDSQLKFKKESTDGILQQGTCPKCDKPEMYISSLQPWLLRCGRSNKCGHTESTRQRYSDLFDNYSERNPPTLADPIATARAYLTENRGFNSGKIAGWYEQGTLPIYGDKGQKIKDAITVRVPLFNGYWERLVDRKDVSLNNKKKTHIKKGTSFKNLGWVPPGQTIEKGDWVFITEAIFKSIALFHADFSELKFKVKTIAAISSSNLPRDFIKEHQGKNITWVLAEDNDNAGITASKKFRNELKKMGERVRVALPRYGADWDDEWRNENLDAQYIKDSLWRGEYVCAENFKDAGFWMFAKTQQSFIRYDYEYRMYRLAFNRIRAEKEGSADMSELHGCWALSAEAYTQMETIKNSFLAYFDIELIAPCKPDFLYAERDPLTRELSFFMRVDFGNGAPRIQERMNSNALVNGKNFHTALVSMAPGAAFYGTEKDWRFIYDNWFRSKEASEEIRSIRFIGYDEGFGGYVFPDYGIINGKLVEKDSLGLITSSGKKVKTNLQGIDFCMPNTTAKLDWFNDIELAFGINGLVTLAFWFGTFFSEQLRKALGFFPFLEMSGKPGTGKSTLLEFFWKASGRIGRYEGINPAKYSDSARARVMTRLSGMPMVMIEGDTDDAKQKFDMNEMKDSFNGAPIRGIGVKTTGGETIEPPFRCGFIVAQNNEADVDKPMVSRFIHLHFTESHFSEKGYKLLSTFRDMTTEDASAFMYRSLINEKVIVDFILERFKENRTLFKQSPSIKMERIQETHALVLACFSALKFVFGESVTEKNDLIAKYLLDRGAERSSRMVDDHADVQTFWEVFQKINIRDVKDPDYQYCPRTKEEEVLNHSKDEQVISIRLVDVAQRAEAMRYRIPIVKELKKLLKNSTHYKYLGQSPIRSKLETEGATDKPKLVRCWNFERPKGE